jgi:polyvinyl alcohol dehydrogenase (cytochrome)
MAADGERVYAAVNKTGLAAVTAAGVPFEEAGEPGLHAVDIDTGEIVWSWIAAPRCDGERAERVPNCTANYGLSAATLLVDGAVVQGSNDGFIRAFEAETGAMLYEFDTAVEFPSANGVRAEGGMIDVGAVIAGGGALYVQSGYGLFGKPGNALIAFRPE